MLLIELDHIMGILNIQRVKLATVDKLIVELKEKLDEEIFNPTHDKEDQKKYLLLVDAIGNTTFMLSKDVLGNLDEIKKQIRQSSDWDSEKNDEELLSEIKRLLNDEKFLSELKDEVKLRTK